MKTLNVNNSVLKSIVQCLISMLLAYIIAHTLMLIWYDNTNVNAVYLLKRLEYAMSNLYNFYFLFFLYSQVYLSFLMLYGFFLRLRIIYLLIFATLIGWLASGIAYMMKEFIMYLTNHHDMLSLYSLESVVIHSFFFVPILSGGWLLGTSFFFFIVKFAQISAK